jgi:hypothetical protein
MVLSARMQPLAIDMESMVCPLRNGRKGIRTSAAAGVLAAVGEHTSESLPLPSARIGDSCNEKEYGDPDA